MAGYPAVEMHDRFDGLGAFGGVCESVPTAYFCGDW